MGTSSRGYIWVRTLPTVTGRYGIAVIQLKAGFNFAVHVQWDVRHGAVEHHRVCPFIEHPVSGFGHDFWVCTVG